MRRVRRLGPKWTRAEIGVIEARFEAGARPADLAREAGVSRQRIHQLLERVRLDRLMSRLPAA